MAVAFRSRSRNSGAASTSISVTKPTGLADGDLVIIQHTGNNGADISAVPAGFSTLVATSANGNWTGGIFYKLITDAAGEGAWTLTQDSSQTWEYVCSAWTGADGTLTTPVEQEHTSFSSSSVSLANITAASDGSMAIAGISVDSSSRTTTAPDGTWTEISDTAADYGTGRQGCAGYHKAIDASTIDPSGLGLSSSGNYWGYAFVINPAAAGPSVTEGTAEVDFGGSVAGSGTAVRLGTASLDFGGSVAATGTIPTTAVLGTVSVSFGGSVSASSLVSRSGSGSVSFGGSVTASGLVTRAGTGACSYGLTVSGTGTVVGPFPATVTASGETDLWSGASGDVADDPWIWRNTAAPASSLILGVSKSAGSDGGVHVFDLDGTEVDDWLLGQKINGVDGRDLSLFPGVDSGWADRVLILATDRDTNQLRFGFMDSAGAITSAGTTNLSFEPYGCCLYVSPVDGTVYAFVSEATGGGDALRQHELSISGSTVSSTQVRSLDTASLSEGMACYDAGELFILGEEDAGLYTYDAEPDGGTSRTTIDTVAGNLTADVEGVTVVEPIGDLPGFIICSSQGASDFQIYDLASPHDYRATFEIVAGTFEGSNDCDGLHAHRDYFGPSYPDGILVAHDATNPTASNYKIVDLGDLLGPLPTIVSGEVVASYGGTVAADGLVVHQGSGALDFGGSVTVDAEPSILGTVSAAYGGAVSADGLVTRLGVATANFGGTVASAGTLVSDGGAVVDFGGSVAAAGSRTVQGSASVAYGGSLAASGIIPTGAVLGTAAAPYGGSVAASGLVRRSGVATVDFGGSVASSGTAISEGGSSTSFGGSVTVDGTAIRLGTAVLDYAASVSATGTIPTNEGEGTAALVFGGAVVAVGQVSRSGIGAVDLGGSVATEGTVRRLGVGSIAYGGSVVVVVDTALDLVDVAHSAVLADWLAHRAVLEESLGHHVSLGFTKEDFMKLRASTSERVPVVVHTTADPTGVLPTFSITADDSGFQSGAWDAGGWDSTTGRIVAWSPLIGSGATLDVAGGSEYDLYIGWTVPGEDPVKETGVLVVE